MIDKEQIAVMIRDTERYLSDLEELEVSKHSDLLEKKKYYASSMVIFAILNRSIDIANEVIAGSKIQIPGSYWDSFYLLGKAKIISEKTAEKMKNLVKYRNVIAHEYYEITREELFEILKKIKETKSFIDEIKKYLKF